MPKGRRITDQIRHNTRYPWSQQKGETPRAYACFVEFRDLGPGRSIGDMIEKPLELLQGKAVKRQALYNMSSRWMWAHRAAAWDRHLDKKRQSAQELAAKKRARKQAKSSALASSICYRQLLYTARKLDNPAEFYEGMSNKDLMEISTRIMKTLKDLQDMDRRAFGEPDQTIRITGDSPGFFDDASKDIMKWVRKDSKAMELWTQFMYRIDELRAEENKKERDKQKGKS